MKRPITILCLSDLHLVPESEGTDILSRLQKKIKNCIADNFKWDPDYIVVAGDLVDGRKKDYAAAINILDSFINESNFNIQPFHVITVPGNHDKDFPGVFSNFSQKKEIKKNCCLSKELESSTFSFDLKKNYAGNFKKYGEFYDRYVNENCQDIAKWEYEYASKYLGEELEDIALTSGLKVFHDTKTCFLTINTEWGYVPDKDGRNRSIIRLCTPVVYESIKTYQNKYPDYMLITVMHRNPIELSWNERNRIDPHKPDILQYIYHYSDILLTGHDHIERVLPPNMLMNKAQHFQLGSASMSSRSNELVQFCAALINVDPLGRKLELLNLRYDYLKECWCNDIGEVFNLVERTGSVEQLRNQADYIKAQIEPISKIPVKSMSIVDVENAVKVWFPDRNKLMFSLLCVYVHNPKAFDEIINFVSKNGKALVVVYSDKEGDHIECQKLIKKVLKEKTIRKYFYLKKFVIVEKYVEVVNPPLTEAAGLI